ncbi:hypothetical protein EV1_041410 [Malus domestica]
MEHQEHAKQTSHLTPAIPARLDQIHQAHFSLCHVMVSEEADVAAEMKPEPQPLSTTLLATDHFMYKICSSTDRAQPAMEARAVDEQRSMEARATSASRPSSATDLPSWHQPFR